MQELQQWHQHSWPDELGILQQQQQQQALGAHSSYSSDPYDAGLVTISQSGGAGAADLQAQQGAQPSMPSSQHGKKNSASCWARMMSIRNSRQNLHAPSAPLCFGSWSSCAAKACSYNSVCCAAFAAAAKHACMRAGAGFAQAALANGPWAREQPPGSSSSGSAHALPPPQPAEPDLIVASALQKESGRSSEQSASAVGRTAPVGPAFELMSDPAAAPLTPPCAEGSLLVDHVMSHACMQACIC